MGAAMSFWIIIASLALGVGAVLALALLRGRSGDVSSAAYDLRVYRDQLKEVDRDLARGVIGKAEAERVRIEVSRRILAADAELNAPKTAGSAARGSNVLMALVLVAVMLGGSLALYARLGTPGYGDLPFEARIAASDQARSERLNQSEAEARVPARDTAPDVAPEYLELMEKLRQTVKDRPDDLRGLGLLVRNEAAIGNVAAAYVAQSEVTRVKGPEATADDYGLLADLMIAAAGGYVSTEAEAALREALQRDPAHPTSRYYLGLYLMQVDRPDAAFRMWEQLLREGPPDAPWIAPIRTRIEELAWRAGVQYELPSPPAGPSAEDIEAADSMSGEDRDAMIRAMVERLSDRLTSEGGSPDEWIQLISAYGVLGEIDQARSAWAEAQQVFSDQPEALNRVRIAAAQAGVAE